MARGTPQQIADKWARRTAGATADYVAGVNSVTEAPGVKAAAQADRYVAGVQRAAQEGKWQDRVAAVSLPEWKQAAAEKGAPRIAAGVQQAQPKMQQFMGELLPFQDNLVAQLDAQLPRGDLESNLNRMVNFAREMSKFRRSS